MARTDTCSTQVIVEGMSDRRHGPESCDIHVYYSDPQETRTCVAEVDCHCQTCYLSSLTLMDEMCTKPFDLAPTSTMNPNSVTFLRAANKGVGNMKMGPLIYRREWSCRRVRLSHASVACNIAGCISIAMQDAAVAPKVPKICIESMHPRTSEASTFRI